MSFLLLAFSGEPKTFNKKMFFIKKRQLTTAGC